MVWFTVQFTLQGNKFRKCTRGVACRQDYHMSGIVSASSASFVWVSCAPPRMIPQSRDGISSSLRFVHAPTLAFFLVVPGHQGQYWSFSVQELIGSGFVVVWWTALSELPLGPTQSQCCQHFWDSVHCLHRWWKRSLDTCLGGSRKTPLSSGLTWPWWCMFGLSGLRYPCHPWWNHRVSGWQASFSCHQ